jgi:hypothetical protein
MFSMFTKSHISRTFHTLCFYSALHCLKAILFLCLLFALPLCSHAFDISFSWKANKEDDLAGYRVYACENGQGYVQKWEGTETSCTLTDLNNTADYCFVVRAFDESGLESADSKIICGNELWQEAEDVSLTAPMTTVSDPEASREKYIETETSNSGTASRTFSIEEAGRYKIVGQVYATNGGTDSFFVDIDSGGQFIWDLNPSGNPAEFNVWRSDDVTYRGTGSFDSPQYDPYVFDLSEGTHTITFSGREASTKLDYFYLVRVGETNISPPPGNSPPTAQDLSLSFSEDTSAQIVLTATDPEGDGLTWTVVSQPMHGNLSGTAPNLMYTPENNYNGSDTFTYQANDGQADSNVATVNITVSPINDAPWAVANADFETVLEGATIVLDGSGSTDPDGDALSYLWTQTGGMSVGAFNLRDVHPSFTAPEINTARDVVTFELIVMDAGGLTSADTCSVTIQDVPSENPAENLVPNPDFESSTDSWRFFTNGSGDFSWTTPGYESNGAGCIDIVSQGTNIQLYQLDIPLEPHTDYRLSFAAYSNTGHDMRLAVVQHVYPYTNYGLRNHRVDIQTAWQIHAIDFTTNNFNVPVDDARLMFWFADDAESGDRYWIDDVVLENVSAKLEPTPTVEYYLNTDVGTGNGFVTPSDGTYLEGSVVSLYATPDAGWAFDFWTGDVADPTSPATTVLMDSDQTATAYFVEVPTVELSMQVSGNGSTTPPAGQHTYPESTIVDISATPDPGWQFTGWSGSVADAALLQTTVLMDGHQTVKANFSETGSVFDEDFQTYPAGADPLNWLDTTAHNSMMEDDTLFQVLDLGGNKTFATSSTRTNIHSHFLGTEAQTLTSYEYTGRMRISDDDGGIGVTCFSRYPHEDAYYRLRRYQDNAFHLSPHGTTISGGTTDTGVVPLANVWYRFRIQVVDTTTHTQFLAKVWRDGSNEPFDWQINAYDDSPTRLTEGTFGIWSYNSGTKYWDDLTVHTIP